MFKINPQLKLARSTGEYNGRMYSRARAEELYRKDNPKKKRAGQKGGSFFGGKTGVLGKIFGKVLAKSKLTAPAPQSAPQSAPQPAPQPAPQAPPPAVTPQAQTESKMIYKNPANITTEYSPFGKPLAAIAPVVLPENYQEPKKASISTSGIAAIGAALLAGLL